VRLKYAPLALLLIIVVGVGALVYLKPLSITNVPEGFDVRFYGFNPWSEQCWGSSCVFAVNGSVDPPYYYSSRGLYNVVFGREGSGYECVCNNPAVPSLSTCHVCVATDSWEVKVSIETPEKVMEDRVVTYWVKQPDGTWKKVVAWREVYEFNVELVSVPKKVRVQTPWGYEYIYAAGVAKDVQLWFVAGTVVWDRAVPDPDNPSKHSVNAYNVPIAVYVVYSKTADWVIKSTEETAPVSVPGDAYNFVITDCDASGRRLTLYDEPSTRADPIEYFIDPFNAYEVNSSLAGDPRPDSRFKSVVYFPITLVQFGPYYQFDYGGGLFNCYARAYVWYPVKTIRLRVIYLRFGEFIYTMQSDTVTPPWETETPHVGTETYTQPGLQWQIPDLEINLGINGTLILIVIALVVILLVLIAANVVIIRFRK